MGKLKKIDPAGGPPQTICDLTTLAIGGSWSRDDVIVIGTGGPLMRVSASGGIPTPITVLDASRKENRHVLPVFLPDGRHFLYLRYSSALENSGIYVGSLDSKPAEQSTKQLVATIFGPGYVSSGDSSHGHLLFLREQVLMKQPFDVSRLELSGEPRTVAEQVGSGINVGFFAASLDSVLVYRTGAVGAEAPSTSVLTWYDGQGNPLGTASEPASYANFALRPDGMRAAVSRLDTQSAVRDIWIIDFVRNTPTRFTFGSGLRTESPVWSPDGTRIVFRSDRDGVYNLYQKPTSGVKEEEVLLKSGGNKTPTSWSHNGQFLLYTDFDPKRRNDLWLLPLDGDRKPVALVATQFNETDGQFNPDGHFVAYVSDESGRFEIYVAEISGTSTAGKWQASQNGGNNPQWRGDGKALFYSAPDGTVMEVAVSANPTFQSGMPKPLFKLPPGSSGFDMTTDGKRFLVAVPVEPDAQTPFTVMLNWQTSFKK